MHWSYLRLSVRCALIAGAAAFAVFFSTLVMAVFGLPVDFFLLSLPLRLTQLITGWDVLAGWKLYVASFLFAPLYYLVVGFLVGLLIEKLKRKKE